MWEKFWLRVKVVPIRWVLLVLGGLALILWLRFAPPTAPWSPHQVIGMVMPESKIVTKIEKVTVQGPERIRVIEKIKYIEKMPDVLTSSTVQDNASHVIASATIPPSPAGGTASAILRVQDGVGTGSIEYQPATPRFFQVKRDFFGEAYYYVVGDRQASAAVGVNPLRVGPIEVKAKAGIDLMRSDSSIKGFVAVGFEYHF